MVTVNGLKTKNPVSLSQKQGHWCSGHGNLSVKINAFRKLINYNMDTALKSNFFRCVRYLYRCGPAYVFSKVAGPGSGGALITGIDDITNFAGI